MVHLCIISFNLNCIMRLKQFYNIATKVNSRKKVLLLLVIYLTDELVRAKILRPLKLGSPNWNQICKRPWLRALLFCGTIDRDQGKIELRSQNLPHFDIVHAITHHQLKLQFPNLEQKCIFNSIVNFKSTPNWVFYVHHWHALVRTASLKVGRIERIRRV